MAMLLRLGLLEGLHCCLQAESAALLLSPALHRRCKRLGSQLRR